MFVIIGYLVVFGAVIGGFVMHGGKIARADSDFRVYHYWRRGGRCASCEQLAFRRHRDYQSGTGGAEG